jgi:hypothetical protein
MGKYHKHGQPVPEASHVSFYICEHRRVHVGLFDENDELIATFAVPPGFADALKEAERETKATPELQ